MKKENPNRSTRISRFLTPGMVSLSLIFLGLMALLVPASMTSQGLFSTGTTVFILWILGLIWLFFLAEFILMAIFACPAERKLGFQLRAFLAVLVPPLRFGARVSKSDSWVWLPFKGWRKATVELNERLAMRFYGPMALIALLVLPLLGLEYLGADQIRENGWLNSLIDISYRLIWFAFALEFAVRISLARGKAAYCKKHVLDLVIIVLPLVAFMRVLRVLRLARVAQLEQLGRMSRMHRLRSGLSKAFRFSIIVKLIKRSNVKALKKQLTRLDEELGDKEREVTDLKAQIKEVRDKLAGLEMIIEKEHSGRMEQPGGAMG